MVGDTETERLAARELPEFISTVGRPLRQSGSNAGDARGRAAALAEPRAVGRSAVQHGEGDERGMGFPSLRHTDTPEQIRRGRPVVVTGTE